MIKGIPKPPLRMIEPNAAPITKSKIHAVGKVNRL